MLSAINNKTLTNNQWFQSFVTAENTLTRYEAMHMIKKDQIRYVAKNAVVAQKQFNEILYGLAA